MSTTFLYSQKTGALWREDGTLMAKGYSGFDYGKNAPEMQGVRNIGPIPRGDYLVGTAYNSKAVGPCAIPLDPVGHDALGRTAFRIHGDSIKYPGTASKGCLIFSRAIRDEIKKREGAILRVIE